MPSGSPGDSAKTGCSVPGASSIGPVIDGDRVGDMCGLQLISYGLFITVCHRHGVGI
jgi:hypothetical protein